MLIWGCSNDWAWLWFLSSCLRCKQLEGNRRLSNPHGKPHMSSCLSRRDAARRQTHRGLTPASIPSALNRSVADPDALFMRSDVCVCERESALSWMSRRRRGMEGVIKLKRLGEDELLRIYESRHWLYNPNPVHSASKDRLGRGGRRGFAEVGWILSV